MPPIMKRDTAKAVSDIMRIKKADENSGAEYASVDGSYEVSENLTHRYRPFFLLHPFYHKHYRLSSVL